MKVIVLLIGIKKIKKKNCRVKIVGIALTSYFRAFLRFFNVIPTIFARHICFNLFITIGNTVPQVTGLDPTLNRIRNYSIHIVTGSVHNKEDDEDVSSDGIMSILCQR